MPAIVKGFASLIFITSLKFLVGGDYERRELQSICLKDIRGEGRHKYDSVGIALNVVVGVSV